jgi:hypothetical protein
MRKLLVYGQHTPMSEWHSRHSNGMCDVTRWPKLAFHCLPRCIIVSSSMWNSARKLTMVGFSPVIIWFFSLLFSLLTGNIQHCPLCFLHFNFKPYSLNLLFCFFFHLYKFFSFQFSYSFTICHFLLISFLILLISYFVLIYFIEVLFFNLVL